MFFFQIMHQVRAMAWRSTAHLSHLRTLKTLEQLGQGSGACEVKLCREHLMYKVSVPREYVPLVVPIITGNVIFPRILRWEVDACKDEIYKQMNGYNDDVDNVVSELFHETAFMNNTLGLRNCKILIKVLDFRPNFAQNLIYYFFGFSSVLGIPKFRFR